MSTWKQVRSGRVALSAIVLMAVVALVVAWGHTAGRQAAAEVPAPGLDFSIAVTGVDGCDTTGGDAKCYVEPGSEFTLSVSLNSLPDDVSEYGGFDLFVTYTGVSSDDNVEWVWPDCQFQADFYDVGEIGPGCAIGLPPAGPSTYTGVIVTNGFTCTASGDIVLMSGEDDTILTDASLEVYAEGDGTAETLTINCAEEPEPTEPAGPAGPSASPTTAGELPPTGTAGGVDANGGVSAGLWALIGTLLAAAAAGLAVFGWRYARSQ